MRHSKHGFTLIELIIVIVIIGILASIAAPMMQGMQKKAVAAEAIAALGTIRTALRAYYAEHGTYDFIDWTNLNLKLRDNYDSANYGKSDLDGTYFSQECYTAGDSTGIFWIFYNWRGENTYIIACFPLDNNCAAKHDIPDKWVSTNPNWGPAILMDETGKIYSNIDGLGYPPTPPVP